MGKNIPEEIFPPCKREKRWCCMLH